MIIDLKISFDLRRLLMSGAIFISDDLVHLCENCPETLCGCISQFLKSTLRELVYGRPAHLSMKTAEGIFYNEQKYIDKVWRKKVDWPYRYQQVLSILSSWRFLFSLDFWIIRFKFIFHIEIFRHTGLIKNWSILNNDFWIFILHTLDVFLIWIWEALIDYAVLSVTFCHWPMEHTFMILMWFFKYNIYRFCILDWVGSQNFWIRIWILDGVC